ncbi:carbohydrate ABC transporter permease, partial [Soehngenia saccharolytica]
FNTNYNGLFSAMVVIILPPVILYCVFSKFFIEALSGGAVKG